LLLDPHSKLSHAERRVILTLSEAKGKDPPRKCEGDPSPSELAPSEVEGGSG